MIDKEKTETENDASDIKITNLDLDENKDENAIVNTESDLLDKNK